MVKTSKFFVVLSLALLAASSLALVSCGDKEIFTPNPNNPKEQTLPAAPFTLKVCEEEPGACRDSVYRYYANLKAPAAVDDGKVTFTAVQGRVGGKQGQENDYTRAGKNYSEGGADAWKTKIFPVEPDVVELVLTPYNKIIFEVDADVNASSSSDVIDIKKGADLRHYELQAIKDGAGAGIREGSSTIRFWNGDSAGAGAGANAGASANAITILVRAANSIPVEGFLLRYTGPDFLHGTVTKFFELKETPGMTMSTIPEMERFTRYSAWNIAELKDVYNRDWNGGDNTKPRTTEECYDTGSFSTIEFVGTIPRNATPDNDIVQVYDLLCHEDALWSTSKVAYGRRSMEDYRWMPVLCRVDKCTDPDNLFLGSEKTGIRDELRKNLPIELVPVLKDGILPQHLYPSDLRYRKAKVWATNYGNRYQTNALGYGCAVNGEMKYFWGYFYNGTVYGIR